MAEYAYPMDSNVTYNGNGVPSFDRAVTSAQLRGMISEIITNGVLMANNSNALRVIANGDNTVTVQPGLCVINGAIKKFTEPNTLLRDAIDFNKDRGIAICALLDPIGRDIRIVFYKYNAQSATDLIPLNLLDREENLYAIQLANIYIAPGSTRIVQSNITDTRLNTERCGAVSSISQFDTTNLYNQIQSDLASFKSTEQATFNEWFKNLQTVLDSNTAAHLQNEIDGLSSSKANKSDITNISITGSANNTGSTITAGTLFYWNGGLYKATTDIPNNSTIVLESNCSSWTVFTEMGLMFSKTDNLTVINNTSSLDNCTSLASVWQAVKWNYLNGYGKICKSGIGALDNTSVKNVIPNPPNFGNYTSIRCKFEASEYIIVIYAIGEHIGKLAKCYLFRDVDNYYLTDWQILK